MDSFEFDFNMLFKGRQVKLSFFLFPLWCFVVARGKHDCDVLNVSIIDLLISDCLMLIKI